MIKKVMNVIAFLVITCGIILLCYPSFANYLNQRFANKEITEFQSKLDHYSEQEIQNMMKKAYVYNATLPGGYPADPFTGENISNFEGTEFEQFSMVQPGSMLGYIEIPKIDVYLPIAYGTSDKVLENGTGLVDNTSLPVGGAGTHAVISGHTGMASKKVFTDLNQMKEGDLFFIHVLNQHFAYQVNQIKVVWPTDTGDLYIEEGRDYVTLLTCTPFGINDHRLLVRGEQIDYDFTTQENSMAHQVRRDRVFWIIILLSVIFMILIASFSKHRKRCRKKTDKSL